MPDTDTDQLSGNSPSTPPSSTSTREPATMDGQTTPRPWLAYFTIHGDPMIVPAQRPWPTSRIADVDTSQPDYGRANAELIATAVNAFDAVSALIEQARKVSPSPAMTVYVGDLEKALGLRVESVRGIVGARAAVELVSDHECYPTDERWPVCETCGRTMDPGIGGDADRAWFKRQREQMSARVAAAVQEGNPDDA